MRVLFATTAGSGHFGPLVPFARACRNAGHEGLVAAPRSFADAVAAAGLAHAPFADVPREILGPVMAQLPMLSFEDANRLVVGEIFGRLDAQYALPGVTALIEQWRPHIVVREPCEFGSLVAAERAGIPQVHVAIGMSGLTSWMLDPLVEPLAELSVLAGLPADRAVRTLTSVHTFTTVPGVLDGGGPADQGPVGDLRRFSDPTVTRAAAELPAQWGDPDQPLVYVTFGSVIGNMGVMDGVFRGSVAALADLPVRVLLTTGTHRDLELGPLPSNTHVEPWWPQAQVMPSAAAMVGHGGFGTTMLAVASGVPQVVVPLFAFDQLINARQVAAVGAGIHLPGEVAAVAELPAAVTRLLADPMFRSGAAAIAAEMSALPDLAESVPILEAIAHH